ncbi:dehydrase and lipid transport-domain-containing protein [Aspergillus taichungensis]|uniref:Dehydrase and lipid transport-domain-containing protein n=1 Tax=Aspergillus taichungensis TaxID=482145 RepID=A0A2J5I449_9EURO|nr:dehydrase and lipid transport-domain-containing protein [Aspergillus taichungensis]
MKLPFPPRQLSRATQRVLRAQRTPSTSLQRTSPTLLSSRTSTSTHFHQQTRPFNLSSLASLLPNNNGGNNNDKHRTLTAIRTLPYAPSPLFKVISSVESYSEFLPFLTASTVTARDPTTNLPTRAFLTVGYGPLSETFTSQVDCDRANWTVEARSGARFGVDSKDGQSQAQAQNSLSSVGFPGANEGIFEYLSTRWELLPLEEQGSGGRPQTRVQLQIQFEFRNQFHAAVMGAVEGQMAGAMIAAFEARIRQLEGV